MKSDLRILNLEDSACDAELTEAMLSARWPACHFVRVQTQGEFLEALEESELDLILSDYSMPGFSGQEALAMAQQKRPEVPFLFVSGTIGEDAAVEALKNGATDYVLKHRLIRLIPAVDRALREVEERAECARAEEAMRQSEYKYRELFESLSDAAFLTDEKTGKIIDTNRAAEQLLKQTRDEIFGHNHTEFFTPPINGQLNNNGPNKVPLPCEMVRADKTVVPACARFTRLTLYGHPMMLWLCHETAESHPA